MKKINFLVLFLFFVALLSFPFSFAYSISNPSISYYSFDSSSSFDQSSVSCENVNDFHLQVAPTGCIPTIVRSDLLEEQNVAVFCPISATKVNPAISVESIKSMTFSGKNPPMVSGTGFYPANAALSMKDSTLSNFPVLENIGYAVIVLKKTENESAMPKFVEGNLTARVSYDSEKAFGIGDVDFYLPELNDYEWSQRHNAYSFWMGKGLLRAEDIDSERARISVYSDEDNRVSTFTLKKGETSSKIYLPGFYCSAGFDVKLLDLVNPRTVASIKVDEDVYNLAVGDKFLENRCQVKSISKQGISQKVSIYCSSDDQKQRLFNLVLSPRVNISGGNVLTEEGSYVVGAKINSSNERDLYVVHLDSVSGNSKINSNELIVWIVSEKHEDSKSSLSDLELENYANRIKSILSEEGIYDQDSASFEKNLFFAKSDKEILGIKNNGFYNSFKETSVVLENDYFSNAIGSYINLSEIYPNVIKKDNSGEDLGSTTYSEEGLILAIKLASELGDFSNRNFLISKFTELYPNSKNMDYVKSFSIESLSSNSGSSSEIVSFNSRAHSISLEKVEEPSFENYGIYLTIINSSGKILESRVPLTKNFVYNFDDSSSVSLTDLSMDQAIISVSYPREGRFDSGKINLKQGVLGEIGGYRFRLEQINLVPVARVLINPEIDNQYGFSNISYKIGIEKRAIKLSPEKIEEKILDLNESIEEWEDISKNLGNVVSGLKGACLATGAVLTVKNFFSGLSGEVTARNYAMRGVDGESGIYKECNSEIAKGTYTNLQKCLAADEIKEKIESSTKAYQEILNEQQDMLTSIREDSLIENSGLGLEKVVDDKKYLIEYSKEVGSKINASLINEKAAENGNYLISDLRTLDFCYELKKKDIALWESSCKTNVEKITKSIEEASSASELISSSSNGEFKIQDVLEERNQVTLPYRGLTIDSDKIANEGILYTFKDKKDIITMIYNGEKYIVFLNKQSAGNFYSIDKAFTYEEVSGKVNLTQDKTNEIKRKVSKVVMADSYDTEVGECVVRYFGSDPDKGHPAVVPFISTKGKGWYVGVRHATVGLGSSSNYDKSGAISSYYICNAGDDSIVNFNPDSGTFSGGDYCTSFSVSGGTVAESEAFGLTKSELGALTRRAVQAIKDAGIYSSSKKTVSVTGRSCRVGDAAADLIQTQCQDFMSPTDCEILFNVCDPVVCPSSRCNLGGTYHVSDVIQSGIVGSLVLCLPNFKLLGGDVYVPICLSGLKAGIDSYLSILKSYRSCLSEKAKSGKTVGVCDQMYSIYLCEFFWSQASSFTDLIVPRLLQLFTGGLVRGGGEYMNIQQSWDNAQSSVSYFTSQYAQGSFDILDGGVASSLVKTEFCQRFASASVPAWEELTEPITPSQFHGSFEEIPFNSAVVPPVSQYSVFYHIYAGTEDGAYYRVYLKSPEGTTVYSSNPTVVVDSGYVPSGEYVSEKKDFTTASGYKEMCISVGEQEECGFGTVSTSFAVNYLKDSLASKSASETEINTESQCISGTLNEYALLNTNLQAGVTNYINPDISSQGIVRVCSSNNPGSTTEPSRWREVGYCNDKNVKCWVDEESIKKAIKTPSIESTTLGEVEEYSEDLLFGESFISTEEFKKIVSDFQASIISKDENSIINNVNVVNNLLEKNSPKPLVYDYQKAYLLFLKGNAYSVLAIQKGIGVSKSKAKEVFKDREVTTEEKSDGGLDSYEGISIFKLYNSSFSEITNKEILSAGEFPIYLENISNYPIYTPFLNVSFLTGTSKMIYLNTQNATPNTEYFNISGDRVGMKILISNRYENNLISNFSLRVTYKTLYSQDISETPSFFYKLNN